MKKLSLILLVAFCFTTLAYNTAKAADPTAMPGNGAGSADKTKITEMKAAIKADKAKLKEDKATMRAERKAIREKRKAARKAKAAMPAAPDGTAK